MKILSVYQSCQIGAPEHDYFSIGVPEPDIKLFEASKALLASTKIAYTILADIRHDWAGRHTLEGQGALCAMRDAIAEAEGRDPEEVQDEYSNPSRSAD